jgi:Response regulator containing CheY-like receiver, AAA-type ATPase, and DNA-binding domains
MSTIQTAMIIDDDPDLGNLMIPALEKRKIHSMAVHTLKEAATYLSFLKPTVIFLDNSFPEGLGINFIPQIKLIDKRIKIIMMTADTDEWIQEKAFEEGVVCFIQKPFSTQTLNRVLDRLNFRKE